MLYYHEVCCCISLKLAEFWQCLPDYWRGALLHNFFVFPFCSDQICLCIILLICCHEISMTWMQNNKCVSCLHKTWVICLLWLRLLDYIFFCLIWVQRLWLDWRPVCVSVYLPVCHLVIVHNSYIYATFGRFSADCYGNI